MLHNVTVVPLVLSFLLSIFTGFHCMFNDFCTFSWLSSFNSMVHPMLCELYVNHLGFNWVNIRKILPGQTDCSPDWSETLWLVADVFQKTMKAAFIKTLVQWCEHLWNQHISFFYFDIFQCNSIFLLEWYKIHHSEGEKKSHGLTKPSILTRVCRLFIPTVCVTQL